MFGKHKNTHLPELKLQNNSSNIESSSEFNFHKLVSSRVIGMINKIQHVYPKEILLSIYNVLILPIINYCLLSWGSGSAAKIFI